jgi:hypothetical protein
MQSDHLKETTNDDTFTSKIANYFPPLTEHPDIRQLASHGESTADSAAYSIAESTIIPGLATSNTVDSFISKCASEVTMSEARFQSQNEESISDNDEVDAYVLSSKTMKIGNMNESTHGDQQDEYALSAKTMKVGNTSEDSHTEQFSDVKISHIKRNCEIPDGDEFVDNPTPKQVASPKIRMNHIAAPSSPRDFEENCMKEERFRDVHVSMFHLGPFKTMFAIAMAIAAFSLSVACKQSTRFVRLDIPLEVGSHYDDITTMGLFYLEMCRADESVSVDNGIVTITDYIYADTSSFVDGPIDTVVIQVSEVEYANMTINSDSPKVCKKIRLQEGVIGDGLWNSTRIFVGLTEWLGGFLAITLISACCWKTMNLVPIAVGLFANYVLQSLAFLFFETELCKENGCFQSHGGNLATGAIICWFCAWIGVLNMIMYDRHEKRKANVIQRKQEIAVAAYAKRRQNRVAAFMYNQLSFLKLFNSSPRVVENRTMSLSHSDDSFVNERIEV